MLFYDLGKKPPRQTNLRFSKLYEANKMLTGKKEGSMSIDIDNVYKTFCSC